MLRVPQRPATPAAAVLHPEEQRQGAWRLICSTGTVPRTQQDAGVTNSHCSLQS